MFYRCIYFCFGISTYLYRWRFYLMGAFLQISLCLFSHQICCIFCHPWYESLLINGTYIDNILLSPYCWMLRLQWNFIAVSVWYKPVLSSLYLTLAREEVFKTLKVRYIYNLDIVTWNFWCSKHYQGYLSIVLCWLQAKHHISTGHGDVALIRQPPGESTLQQTELMMMVTVL